MLKILAALLLWGLSLTAAAAADRPAPCAGTLVYFGSFTDKGGKGVLAARLDERTGRLCSLGQMADVEQSTWIVKHPDRPVIYVTRQLSGVQEPAVFAYRVDLGSGALRLINATPTGGAGPTHLSVDARSGTLFAAHWDSGHVSALPIRSDGGLGAPASVQPSTGPGPAVPRTHAIRRDPGGRFVLATEYGLDRLLVYRFDPRARRLTPSEPAFVSTPPRSGPRHFVFHPNGRFAYLLNERTSQVAVYRWDAATGALQVEQTISTLGPGYQGRRHAATIVITPDARHLYLSNRGEDVIVGYAVDPSSGRLTEIQRIGSGGRSPRDFAISPSGRWMVVANQESNMVSVLARDPRTGRLTRTEHGLAAQFPVVAAFVARN